MWQVPGIQLDKFPLQALTAKGEEEEVPIAEQLREPKLAEQMLELQARVPCRNALYCRLARPTCHLSGVKHLCVCAKCYQHQALYSV